MSADRLERIRARLIEAFAPEHIELQDDSAAHAGHAGARSGGGHFDLFIVAEAFAGKRPLERHRLIYAALDELMNQQIHALSIRACAPQEL